MNAPVSKTSLPLDPAGLDLLFREARTFNAFLDQTVADETVAEAIRLAHLAPTGVNAVPGRFLVVKSAEARQRLVPLMSEGNRAKTLAAPVTIITAGDAGFTETLIRTFPQAPAAKDWFPGQAAVDYAAFNAALQTGYLILALRAVGLDAGPMGGFDKEAVDKEFFAGTSWKSTLVINVGYGDRSKLHPRNPRLDASEYIRTI